jgi:hypothetical protein
MGSLLCLGSALDRLFHGAGVRIEHDAQPVPGDPGRKVGEAQFRKAVVWLIGSRLAGTLLAQALLVPSAWLIMHVARAI